MICNVISELPYSVLLLESLVFGVAYLLVMRGGGGLSSVALKRQGKVE